LSSFFNLRVSVLVSTCSRKEHQHAFTFVFEIHRCWYMCLKDIGAEPYWHCSVIVFLQEPERQRHVAFQGVGRTLGSSSTALATEPTADSAPLNSAPTPFMGLVVDETLPSTSIQLRLADGTRMVAHFNNHHTVNDIRSFIDASRPGAALNYQLQLMGFPPKLLTDPTQTIEQAGLANSVVIQKF